MERISKAGPGMTGVELTSQTKKYTMGSWMPQDKWNPINMVRGKGVYFWDADGKRYLDWSSQLINVNIGHGNEFVNQAIKDHLDKVTYAYPAITTDARAQAGKAIASVTPDNHNKSFFTTGGADANENAMIIARLFTGRQKIIARYRAYHGSTFGSMSAGGDPRKLANEPGVPWIVHVHDPYAFRGAIYENLSQDEGDRILVGQMEETIIFEGPESIAAIILEGYSGSSGAFNGGPVYWKGIQALCDKYNILLIIDEILSGFGRTGKWFAFQHNEGLRPDIITMAKGLTSAYVPMGAVSLSDRIASHFDTNTLWAGLTYNAHPLGCAAAAAVIEFMKREHLVEHAAFMGNILEDGLRELAAKHPCVGEVRGRGLLHVFDLVRNTKTKEALSGFHQPLSEPLQKMQKFLLDNGLSTLVRWNYIFSFPPLIINEDQVKEGLQILDGALSIGDGFVER